MILQRTSYDFRRTGRTAIDEHDHRLAISQITLARIEARHILRITTTGRNDFALVEEGIGNSDSLIEQTTRVEAQVKHIALELIARELFLNVLDRLLEVIRSLFGEGNHTQIADIILDARTNGLNLDHSTVDLERDRLVCALTNKCQLDWRTNFTAHLFNRIAEAEATNFLTIDLTDQIACEDTSFGGWRIIDWRNDLNQIVVHGDFNTKTAKLTLVCTRISCAASGLR